MNGTILESNATCELQIDPEPLLLNINGGSFREVSPTNQLTIQAEINRINTSGDLEFRD